MLSLNFGILPKRLNRARRCILICSLAIFVLTTGLGCTDQRDHDLSPSSAVSPVVLDPNSSTFVRGLRALLVHLRSGDTAALGKAVADLDAAGTHEPSSSPSRKLRVKRGLYRALAHERNGSNRQRDELIRAGVFSMETYRFIFHGGLARLEDVIRMQLQQEDDAHLRYLRQALGRHARDSGGVHPRRLAALVPRYLKAVPLDPACPAQGYAGRYGLLGGGRFYSLPPCAWFELGGKKARRKVYDTAEEYRIFTRVMGDDLDRRRLGILPQLLKLSGVKKGDVVADVGAGPGLFSWPLAEVVGPTGKVYAADTNRGVLSYLRFAATRKPGLKVQPHPCDTEDVKLPRGTVDVAFVIQTYLTMISADADDPLWFKEELEPWLTSIRDALRSGGRLVIQDRLDRIPPATLRRHLGKVGFRHQHTETMKGRQFMVVFVKP